MSNVPVHQLVRAAVAAALLAVVVLASGCGAGGAGGAGGGYPRRDVQVVVPYPAGSGIDTTTRALVDVVNAQGTFGRRLQVVNREGGAGSVGTTEILNAKPDGYTVGVVPDGPLALIPQTEDVSYDPAKVTVLGEVITSPIMFAVPAGSRFRDLEGLLGAAKADPGSVTIGEGPLNYRIPADRVEQVTGARFKRVKFDGDQATTTALLGDNVDVGVMQLASALPQLRSGKLRALGVTSADRVEQAPDIRTFREQGVDLQWQAYNVAVAPDGVPAAAVERLSTALRKAIASPEFARAADRLGLAVSGAAPEVAKRHLADKEAAAADVLQAAK